MTETNKPGPNSEDEQPDKAKDQDAPQPSFRRAEQRSSANSSDSDFAPVSEQDFLVTFKNLLYKAESDSQPSDSVVPVGDLQDVRLEHAAHEPESESEKSDASPASSAAPAGAAPGTHLKTREIGAGQLEERVLHGGQIKQVVDRVTGMVTTTIASGPIEAIIHRPGLSPEITMRDAGAENKLVRDSNDALAIAEARGKGKTVTIFSDGRVEIRPTYEQQEESTETRTKLVIEYPPYHASGLVGRTEYEPNAEGKTILFITRDGAGEVTETTTYLGREDGIILTTKKTTNDGRVISSQVYANGTKVTADETGLHIEESEPDLGFADEAEVENFAAVEDEPEEFEGDVLEALLGPDEQMKLAAAKSLLAPANEEEVLRWMALDFITQLQSSRTKESRAEAQQILKKLRRSDATIALRHLAQIMPSRSRSEGGPVSRRALNAVPILFSKVRDDSDSEASVYRLAEYISKLNDNNLTNSINAALDRTTMDCELSCIQSTDDPRIAAMIDALTNDLVDSALKFNAAIALGDVSAIGVDPSVREVAKKVVYQNLDGMIERALRFENNHEMAKGQNVWNQIDGILQRIGESEEGFGKNYVSTRRFELEGRRIQGDF